ncbi:MAG TPA: Holliday junction branch migration protein RuvA [Bacteroidetes bacterium]|nr:MAG: Holliday junction DNA helicase RuvA [Ignavibacteria bacterium GWA2_54_16]HCA78154.1 Holliday junction branch migration protein RuvA [Bacteroidota bacterium]
MIGSLTGTLKHKSPTEVVLDVNGVGYAVIIPFSTYEKLGDLESRVTLVTHLHVREDALQLFGFFTEEERFFFKLLISVNGIGPKIAQGILSGISVPELRQHIANGNISALTAIPGVGKKTAERLVIELRDKIGKIGRGDAGHISTEDGSELRQEALLALTSLGYNRQQAEKAIRQVLQETTGEKISLQDLIKKALRLAANG